MSSDEAPSALRGILYRGQITRLREIDFGNFRHWPLCGAVDTVLAWLQSDDSKTVAIIRVTGVPQQSRMHDGLLREMTTSQKLIQRTDDASSEMISHGLKSPIWEPAA